MSSSRSPSGEHSRARLAENRGRTRRKMTKATLLKLETVFGKILIPENLQFRLQSSNKLKLLFSDLRTVSSERRPDSLACCAKSTAAMLPPSNSSLDLSNRAQRQKRTTKDTRDIISDEILVKPSAVIISLTAHFVLFEVCRELNHFLNLFLRLLYFIFGL